MKEIPSVIILLLFFIYLVPAVKNNVVGIGAIVIVLFLIEAVLVNRNEETAKRNKSIFFYRTRSGKVIDNKIKSEIIK
jgi:hypothetical protein